MTNAVLVVSGVVEEGTKRGRMLGFPTANIPLTIDIEDGVFAGKVTYKERKYLAALFIPKTKGYLEAHLLDFSGDLYGSTITVEITGKIRDSVPYTSDDDMKRRIQHDIELVRETSKNISQTNNTGA